MTTKILTPPAEMPVTLEEAKLSLREDGAEKDALIRAWILGVTEYAEHYTGRSFIHRPVRVTLDTFPVDARGRPGVIFLDFVPAASVTNVRFLDANDVQQTVDPQDYVTDLVSEPGCVVIARGKAWPVTSDKINSVTCDYVAGYSADSSGIPGGIKLYILAKLAEQFDQSQWVRNDTIQSSFIDRLLYPYQVYA